jgi:hypothetical protein
MEERPPRPMIPRGQATVNGRWRSQLASVHSDLVTQIRGGIFPPFPRTSDIRYREAPKLTRPDRERSTAALPRRARRRGRAASARRAGARLLRLCRMVAPHRPGDMILDVSAESEEASPPCKRCSPRSAAGRPTRSPTRRSRAGAVGQSGTARLRRGSSMPAQWKRSSATGGWRRARRVRL